MPSPLNLRTRLQAALQAPQPASTPLSPASALEGVRADAATQSTSLSPSNATSGSGMANALSGLGMARDSGASARPNPYRQYLTEEELVALMRGGVSRRIAELLPKWATWKGWRLMDDDEEETHPLQAEMRALGVGAAVRKGMTWGRGLGEALVWPVTLGDEGDLSEPLRTETVRGIKRLIVVERREFSVAEWESEPDGDQDPGTPRLYHITLSRPGVAASYTVHASRVWMFGGDALPPRDWGRSGGYGAGMHDSVFQSMWDAIRDLSQTSAAGAHLAQELSIFILHLAKGQQADGGTQRESYRDKVAFFNMTKSVARLLLLTKDDKAERLPANPAGYKDLSEGARLQLALVSGVPAALLYGEAPAGLSTDEKSWWANWTATVAQEQDSQIRPFLEWLVPMLYQAHRGAVPDSWTLEFNPIGEPTLKELAEIAKTNAETDKVYKEMGALTVERIARSRFGGEGYGHEIQPPTDEELALLEDPDLGGEEDLGAGEEGSPELVQDADGVYHLPTAPARLDALGQACARADASAASIPKARRSETFAVPAFARAAAKRVLRWRQMHPRELNGMTPTGWRRARQLATKSTVTLQDLIEISAWFARHSKNITLDPDDKGKPWRDPGYVAGLGWGSAKMGQYASRIVERIAKEEADRAIARRQAARKDSPEHADLPLHRADVAPDSTVLLLEVPPDVGFQQAQAAALGVLGELELEDAPHVTLLYLGGVAQGKVPGLVRAIGEVLADTPTPAHAMPGSRLHATKLYPHRLGHFGDGDPGDDGVPVVVHYHSPLGGLHELLVRRLVPWISVQPYERFIAHATLGYLKRRLSGAESLKLGQLDTYRVGLQSWSAAELVLNRGGEEVARWSLAPGRLDAAEAAK